MDSKSQYLLLIMGLLIVSSIVITYHRIVILRDYEVLAHIACDPAHESCFTETCDPLDDSECPNAESERTSYYKIIHKQAQYIPLCDPNEETCPELSCAVDEAGCSIEYCDPSVVEEGMSCDNL